MTGRLILSLQQAIRTKRNSTIKAKALQELNTEGKSVRLESRSKYRVLLQKAGIAALTTALVYFTFMYLYLGRFIFGPLIFLELLFAFFFLLGVFWSHTKISSFINSEALSKMASFPKALLEAFLVIISSAFFLSVLNYLPMFLIFPDAEYAPGRIRVGYVVSTIISLFFYYFVERERSRKQLQAELLHSAQLQKENFQAQLQSLKNQVNPHFLFNSLNVLGSIIHKDKDQAVEFVRKLSDVYRSFLDHSYDLLVPLQKEMELTEAYIYLLSSRFGDNIRFHIEVPADCLSLQLPPASLQMLIENAVKHNGSTPQKPLLINIQIEENRLVVRNNLQPRQERVQSTRTGLNNIIRRYQFLTEEEVDIEKNSDEFMVKLPLLKVEEYESTPH